MRCYRYIAVVLVMVLCSIFLCSCESTNDLKESLCISIQENHENFEVRQFRVTIENNTPEEQVMQLEWIRADGIMLHPLWIQHILSNHEAEFQISVRKKAIPKDCKQLCFYFTVQKAGEQMDESFVFVFSLIEEKIKMPFLTGQKRQQKMLVSC